ncbi:hypothetical protein B1400_0637 [Bifidobacterium italicum]|uniref:Uncharacterized protein n=1 Tax=Bifidobacterium italicum TaxID=1960968 RepID=A0A2A2EL65_9BIFI|nr:hypothetical protein [Bifidobacterium italicum]PAU69665.1 hypothetical protein B1400_0637 [Bifidobacterium italicum]
MFGFGRKKDKAKRDAEAAAQPMQPSPPQAPGMGAVVPPPAPTNGHTHGPVRLIDPVPGQPQDMRVGVVQALEQPEGGQGYIVELTPVGQMNILAWIGDDDAVHPTSTVLAEDPGTADVELKLDPWNEGNDRIGAIFIWDTVHGFQGDDPDIPICIGEYTVDRDRSVYIAQCSLDAGTYGSASHPRADAIAACWLLACRLPALRGERITTSSGRFADLFDQIEKMPLPDAIDMIIHRGTSNTGRVTPVERALARQLVEIGAPQLRAIAANTEFNLRRLDTTGQFWINFDEEAVQGLQRDLVIAVEGAFNRAVDARNAAAHRDNDVALLATLDERTTGFVFRDAFGHWGEHARFARGQIDARNPYMELYDAHARRGGAWESLTRFGNVAERLRLPLRLQYGVDVDNASGAMAIAFSAPTAMGFPASCVDDDGVWRDVRDTRGAQASVYALRLAGLLAYVGFSSSTATTSVTITARAGTITGTPVLSMRFERMAFYGAVLPYYLGGDIDDDAFSVDPAALLRLLAPAAQAVDFGEDLGLRGVTPLPMPPAIKAHRVPLWKDMRELPADLGERLRAERACELDVLHDDAPISIADVEKIIKDNEESPVSAAIELESVVMELSKSLPQETPTFRPLYCNNQGERELVTLADDDDPQTHADGRPSVDPSTIRYFKVPDALFRALIELARISIANGQLDKARELLARIHHIGKLSIPPYVSESVMYVDVDEPDWAKDADVLTKALPYAVEASDVAMLYYRLAYAMRNLDKADLSAACYAMTLTMPVRWLRDTAIEELSELLDGDLSRAPAIEDAKQLLRANGIPIVPSHGLMHLLARNTIDLVDAGFPKAAGIGTRLLAAAERDDTLNWLGGTLLYGTYGEDELGDE